MDEKVLGEIKLHQDVVAKDANSPLYQIREKELEISGRVLAARNQADRLITEARDRAAALLKAEQERAATLAQEKAAQVAGDAERALAEIAEQGERDISTLQQQLQTRQREAVRYVVDLVTGT